VRFVLPPLSFAIIIGLFPSCQKQDAALQEEVMADETKLIQLQQNLRLLHYRLDQRSPSERALNDLQREELQVLEEMARIKSEMQLLREDMTRINVEHAEYAKHFHDQQEQKRMDAMAMSFKVFSSTERDYHDVVITAVDDQGVQITHKDGRARVAVEHLTNEQLATFGLNREQALTSRAEEQKKAVAYDRWVEKSLQQQQKAAQLVPESPQRPLPTYVDPTPPPSPFRYSSTKPKTIYRVRNQGRPSYYYVYPIPNCPSSNYDYSYRIFR
jgi:hypothetical protein